MQTQTIAAFFERDLGKYIAELNLFKTDEDIWKVLPGVTNTAGNLALHMIGGLNHHVGATLGNTGYVRNRDAEFADKDIPKAELVTGLEKLIATVAQTVLGLSDEDLQKPFPKFFDKEGVTTGYVLTQLLIHTNYHLGQVNYLRRILEHNNTTFNS